MLELVNIRVRSLDLRALTLTWQVKPTPEEVLDYRFMVLRSEAAGGPWDEKTDWFTDRYMFLDDLVEPYNAHRTFHYLIRVKKATTGETRDFGPVVTGDEPDMIALEVRRHWEVVLHELTGRRSWLFPVRTFGSTCRNCYDPNTGRSNNSRCLSCYGTGFVRGFLHPIEVRLQTSPHSKRNTETPPVIQQRVGTQMYLPAFPDVKPKDLIVEPDNRRWRVANVESTARLGVPLHQVITLSECELGDVEFEVPVNFTQLLSAPLAEPRNYQYRTTL